MTELWAEFQNNLNDARIGMEGYDKKGGRSKGRLGAIRQTKDGLVHEWDKDKFRISKEWRSKSAESD